MKATKIPAKTETKVVEIEPAKYVVEFSKQEVQEIIKALGCQNYGYNTYEGLLRVLEG